MRQLSKSNVGGSLIRLFHQLLPTAPQPALKEQRLQAATAALIQFHVMVRNQIEPDALMYTHLISTMGRAGLEWQAYKFFSRMLQQCLTPLPETYVALRFATKQTRQNMIEDITKKLHDVVSIIPEKLAESESQRQEREGKSADEAVEKYLKGDLPLPQQSAKDGERHDVGNSTVFITHPHDVWNTFRLMECKSDENVLEETRKHVRQWLQSLHDEELRIFLISNKQLQHGARSDLLDRILSTVCLNKIQEMLLRRKRYFLAVQSLLENEMRQIEGSSQEEDSKFLEFSSEEDKNAQNALFTPWGIVRKPEKASLATFALKTAHKEVLSANELDLLYQQSMAGNFNNISDSMLKKYAQHFDLKWKRRVPGELQQLVQWHLRTFPRGGSKASPTPSLKSTDEMGVACSLDVHDAFRIISQATKNMQIVDARDVSHSVSLAKRRARARTKDVEEVLRRERNIAVAHTLRLSSHTLRRQEVPPWEFKYENEPYCIRTSTFGDPERGQITELNKGNFQLLPKSDRNLVDVDPDFFENTTRKAFLSQKSAVEKQIESEERVMRLKQKSPRYRSLRKLIDRQKEQKTEQNAHPPPGLSMAQILRAGNEKQKIPVGG